MGNRYVSVTITRQTKAASQQGFGTPLMLATSKAAAYKEYAGDSALSGIGADFGTSSREYKLAEKLLGQQNKPEKLAVYGTKYDGTTGNPEELKTALNTLMLEHADFYYLVCPEQGDDEIKALSDWVNVYEKLYFASTTNVALPALNSDNTFIMITPKADTEFPAEALVGYIAPLEIGSYTVQFKSLNGVSPANFGTEQETIINAIHEKNMATYIREGGVNIVSAARATSGEFIDIIQSAHYLNARMTENVFRLLTTLPKVPFTNGGIALMAAEMEATLKGGYNNGMIAEEEGVPLYTVTAPRREEISKADRANRVLPDMRWQATIAGAIHNVKVAGVIQV
ncbi:uncharacterized protein DUF3383 [Brevibacillus sp. AG162]|uniref:DUF3383 family protein n=1 Tax=Brevibacillus sp. AG162 TaxID=2572910 RepID=UPI0011530E5E|nr:DUF3383 family protein [Brevibacillus sp. AG162]TQK41967.1 uncharacterized protein DUF3383 [Brevibacillus sp. AG162]